MERDSKKDRLKFNDSRYQSIAFPEFVDRRSGRDRRKKTYQDLPGHPSRKWMILIGTTVAIFLIWLLFLTRFVLTEKRHYKTLQRKNIIFGYHQDNGGNYASAFRNSLNRTATTCFS